MGIVFRRGPSKLVRMISWNREIDKFTPGQSFKGTIYPEYSDISPDGRHMIYFAMGGVAWAIPATGGTWTAISRVPSFTELALWPQDGSTRDGGGMFTSNTPYWLETHRHPLRNDTTLKRVFVRPAQSRTERDGWVIMEGWMEGWPRSVIEQEIPKGWIFRLRENYPGVRYELERREPDSLLQLAPID